MRAMPFAFRRPERLAAAEPPESRGLGREGVRLLVSAPGALEHHRFLDLPELLDRGDLLVVNESATLPASVPAEARFGAFRVNVSTSYGRGIWLVEPRWEFDRPGPVPLTSGESFRLAGLAARVVAPYPSIPRLIFVQVEGELPDRMRAVGVPIRYGYTARAYPLEAYQSVFSRHPGSAEMPSAGRPFTPRTIERLRDRGVGIAPVTLHAGVSSLATEDTLDGSYPVFPEPFEVPAATASEVNRARAAGRRVIAVGTTVVRALASAQEGGGLRAARGFTRLLLTPARPDRVVDGLLTGLHDPGTSHLAMLCYVAGVDHVQSAYRAAVETGYLWHEFGDTHLMLAA